MDHLLKFHPFGFSWSNLEHIPEIISVNHEPNLRGYIEDLIRNKINRLQSKIGESNLYKYASYINYRTKRNDLKITKKEKAVEQQIFCIMKKYFNQKMLEDDKNN